MTPGGNGEGRKTAGHTLFDIAQLLESADGASRRVRRVLQLLHGLVPYDECAMLDAQPGHEPQVMIVPEPTADERREVKRTLLEIFGKLVETNAPGDASVARPEGVYLAVPLVGLDEVIGLLFVRSSVAEYDEEHLRTLAVVAAKLGAYFMMLRAHAALADLARERDTARLTAETANRAKDEFLALVSNELKTPLNAILAWAHILRAPDGTSGARSRALDEIDHSAQQQIKLIDDILDLACITSAELRLNLRTIEPAALIKTALQAALPEAARKSIQLESDLDATAMPLVLDPVRIARVVSIPVANAIDFTPPGGHVGVHLEGAADYARIWVSDGGSGIAPEALPYVFDRFQRIPGADPSPVGTTGKGFGVGLAIVKDLVELHGGRVRAESAGPERGATFTVELPRRPATPAVVDPHSGTERSAGNRLRGIRVLFVDSDFGLRESFQSVLTEHGDEVTTVASASAALAALERSLPDVLLVGDLATRAETCELVRELTARLCPLPIAGISARKLDDSEHELAAGFRVQLAKPIEISVLVGTVASLAGRTRRQAPSLRLVPSDDLS